jgi:hypothetical protein
MGNVPPGSWGALRRSRAIPGSVNAINGLVPHTDALVPCAKTRLWCGGTTYDNVAP